MAEIRKYNPSDAVPGLMIHTEDDSGEWVRFSDVESLLPKWIKCSERLPEDARCVLVSDVHEDVLVGWHDGEHWHCDSDTNEVIAWQPLPAPLEANQ